MKWHLKPGAAISKPQTLQRQQNENDFLDRAYSLVSTKEGKEWITWQKNQYNFLSGQQLTF